MTHVVVALDSFKGSVGSAEAGAAARAGILAALPDARVEVFGVADGGEGTVAALAGLGRGLDVPAVDLLGRPVTARCLLLDDGAAVVESAAVAGLGLLGPPGPASARRASSAGLGVLLDRLLDTTRPHRVLVGLGGTGVTDGGVGLLLALGGRAWDREGRPVPAAGNPLLERPVRVELPEVSVELVGLADVDAPLLGESGAARLFAPQKGADPALVAELEEAMCGWARALAAAGHDVADLPGAGAAGGIGAAVAALGGRVVGGLETVAAATGLADAVADADLVVTGEGSIDAQTGLGKVPAALARLARGRGRAVVVGLAGSVAGAAPSGLDAAFPVHSRPRPLAEALDARVTLAEIATAAERVGRLWSAAATAPLPGGQEGPSHTGAP